MGRQQQRLERQFGGAGDLLETVLDAERKLTVELSWRVRRIGWPLQAWQCHDRQPRQCGFPISAYAKVGERVPLQHHEIAELDRGHRRQASDAATQAVKVALDPFGQEGGDAPAVQDGMVETDAEMNFVVCDQMDVDTAAGSFTPIVAPAP